MNTEWIVIIVIAALIIFGSAKIPQFMRGMGKGIREFKEAVHDPENDGVSDDTSGSDGGDSDGGDSE